MPPLEEDTKTLIRQAYKSLGDNTPGFRPRAAQRQMIGGIATHVGRAYKGDERPEDYTTPIAVIEAGTGTGKTYGYCIPLIALAQKKGKKLIISTGTVALQEQIVAKDLPDLHARSLLPFNFVLAKGRRRYVCASRLQQEAEGIGQGAIFESYDAPEGEDRQAARARLYGSLMDAFRNEAWTGDRDTWPEPIPDSDWAVISTDRHGCTGNQCSHRSECPFFDARAAMSNADVVVANHDLLLSDLAMGGGVILPDPQEALLAIDEGHHLPDKALEHGSSAHWVGGARDWLGKMGKVVQSAYTCLPEADKKHLGTNFQFVLDKDVGDLNAVLSRLSSTLFTDGPFKIDERQAEDTWRFPHGKLPDQMRAFGKEILPLAKKLHKALRDMSEKIRVGVQEKQVDTAKAEMVMPELGFMLNRAENVVDTWRLMLEDDEPEHAPLARWITAKNKGAIGLDYLVAVSPIDAGAMLNNLVWNRFAGVVVTSATLTALGRFDLFLQRTGLTQHAGVETHRLESPFDYQNNGVIEVPPFKADPKDAEAHTAEIIGWCRTGIDPAGATLMLFSSYRQLRAVRDALPDNLKALVKAQGDLPKGELIRLHKAAVDAGQGSIIMGVDSMGEGVDLPGDYCTHVVISKLPFTVPTTPIEAATAEWVEARGGKPFFEITVPAASTKLIQWVGRLL
ncbi:MAG: ATP-dependent DNA helicase DinG, partial [Bacillota bacterium]